jgi:ATP phosphoribosyltransferase
MRDRLRLAIPNKGRLVDPTLALLHDAGLVFEEHDRSLVAHVQNHPLDVLFVRTGDVIEFVNDGVADAGITGDDILAESGIPLPVLCHLGYGRCRLAAAAPADAPYQAIADLAGTRLATSHPNVTRRFFADQSIPVEVITLSGAVEVAPRLGLADAIVDLVSSGNTLKANQLVEVERILSISARLIVNPAALKLERTPMRALIDALGAAVARGRA